MKYKKIIFTAIFFISLGYIEVQAQEASTTAGGNASSSSGSVSYSVGQVVYTTNTGANGSVAQGVQQPYEISTTGLEESGITLNLSAYPNPTTDYLVLQSEKYSNEMSYQLYNINGQLLETKKIVANTTNIIMEQYASTTYFLKVTQNNKEIKTFKIIKN
ncbi:hypothetical protein BH10BAC1_BH10BAC1_19810 [soil metagenome]